VETVCSSETLAHSKNTTRCGVHTNTRLERCARVLEYTDIPKVFFTPQSYYPGHCCTDVIRAHCCATKCFNNDLGFHFCATISLGHSWTNIIRGHCCITTCSNNYLGSHCRATMTPGHAACLLLGKRDRHDALLKCSSVTLEREHLIMFTCIALKPSNPTQLYCELHKRLPEVGHDGLNSASRSTVRREGWTVPPNYLHQSKAGLCGVFINWKLLQATSGQVILIICFYV
jgi:hypothetical protein